MLHTGTDRFEQIVQTQIRLLLKEQYDQDLHYLPFHMNFFDALLNCKIKMFHFRTIVVVVLLFYIHGKHLRSCRDGQLT